MSLLDNQLVAFMAVAKYKNLHAAAEILHVTQTAMTQRIQALEKRLKTALFIRSRKGMQITQDGEILLQHCFAVYELENNLFNRIGYNGMQEEVAINISGSSSIMQSRIIPACLPLMKQYPNLLLQYTINDLENRHLSLKNNECQLTILNKEHISKTFGVKKLKPEQYVLVCSEKWRNRKLKEIIQEERIIDFNPEDQITFHYLKHYHLFDLARKERYFVNQTGSIAKMVADGYGYSLLTKEFAHTYLKEHQLMLLNKGQSYEHEIYLAWLPRPQMPEYFMALLKNIN